jgi:hypothetical protein
MSVFVKKLPWVLLTVIWALIVLAVILFNRQYTGAHFRNYTSSPALDSSIQRLTLTNTETDQPSKSTATFNQQTKEFNWTPAEGDAGTYRVKVTAANNDQRQEEIITIVVNEK